MDHHQAKYYTGVGSRRTPHEYLEIMTLLARKLDKAGWTLRSGGAQGADQAFEDGASTSKKEIFYAKDATSEAMEIARRFHPNWGACAPFAQKLHGRNAFQVLGKDLKTPSRFLVCWTPDACFSHEDRSRQTGGTGTAISIADHYNVQIFNLGFKPHLDRIAAFVGLAKDEQDNKKLFKLPENLPEIPDDPYGGLRL